MYKSFRIMELYGDTLSPSGAELCVLLAGIRVHLLQDVTTQG